MNSSVCSEKLIPRETAESLVMRYHEAVRLVNKAHGLLEKAEAQKCSHIPTLTLPGHNYWDIKDILEQMKRDVWGGIIRRCDIRGMMSLDQQRKLDDQLNNGELPDLTVPNVFALLERLKRELPDHVQGMCEEVWKLLTPDPRYTAKKTNDYFRVGPKVIMEHWIDTAYGLWLYSAREPHIRALDNCFHLLDGQGLAEPPNDLNTVLRDAVQRRQHDLETDYFRIRWFKAGTVHIWFKRMDLVQDLNRRCGGEPVLPGMR